MSKAVFSGTFDPFTSGHLDVLQRASKAFEWVTVGVLNNASKKPAFTPEERIGLITKAIEEAGIKNADAKAFSGLLVDFMAGNGATFIVRGLRNGTDLDYEAPMDAMNRRLAPDTDTVYFLARPEHAAVSSSLVRELASYGADISGLVPASIEEIIAERLNRR